MPRPLPSSPLQILVVDDDPAVREALTAALAPPCVATSTYDRAHRLQAVTDSRAGTRLTFTYTPGGHLRRVQDSDEGITDYTYDPAGRPQALWTPSGDVVVLAYDPGGRLTDRWFPTGVHTEYTYFADNTLQRVKTRMGETVLAQHEYTYNDGGQRLSRTETLGGTTGTAQYGYDPLGRLTSVTTTNPSTTESYTHDVFGNRLTKTTGETTWTYAYSQPGHQLTRICDGTGPCSENEGTTLATFSYDATGNLTARTTGSQVTTYTYTPDNRLAAVITPTATESYAYDPEGRRIRVTAGTSTTEYLYQGSAIYAEYDSTWTAPLARYAHGPGIDQPLLRTTGTGTSATTVAYHPDGLGSLVGLTDATGSLAAWTKYDAWGNVLTSSGTIPQYGYTGREPDGTGLVYYRARYYDPTLGRFTQRDPIGLKGGLNPYLYVGGNPVNFTDPSGELAFFWHFGITYFAGRESGKGIWDSLVLGWKTMMVDWGTQGFDKNEANIHSMLGTTGTDRGGAPLYQSPAEGLAAIAAIKNTAPLPTASHTAQDEATPGHFLEEWRGFGLNLSTMKHLWGDIFPSLETIKAAFANTLELLMSRQNPAVSSQETAQQEVNERAPSAQTMSGVSPH